MTGMFRNMAFMSGVAILAVGGTALFFTMQQHQVALPSSQPEPQKTVAWSPLANQNAAPPAAGGAAAPPASISQPAPANLDAPELATPPTVAAQAPAGAAAPAVAPPATPLPEPSPDVWPQGVTPVKFHAAPLAFTLIRDSAAYVAPNTASPRMYPMPAGTPVYAIEQSDDGNWVIAMTEDGKAAYLPKVDLGRYDPVSAANRLPSSSVSGAAKVIDTATLAVAGQTITLAGIQGKTGIYARNMQAEINAHGRIVSCDLQGQTYLCRLGGGQDIARDALFNGAAEPAEDASEDYRDQAEAARSARRGIWRGQ